MTSDPVSRGVAGLITSAAQRMVGGATWLVTGGLDPGLRPVLTRNLASRPARAALTAAENVALPLRLRGDRHAARLDRRAVSQRVGVLMDQLSLNGLQGHGPDEI